MLVGRHPKRAVSSALPDDPIHPGPLITNDCAAPRPAHSWVELAIQASTTRLGLVRAPYQPRLSRLAAFVALLHLKRRRRPASMM
jgi:hypothetical protein